MFSVNAVGHIAGVEVVPCSATPQMNRTVRRFRARCRTRRFSGRWRICRRDPLPRDRTQRSLMFQRHASREIPCLVIQPTAKRLLGRGDIGVARAQPDPFGRQDRPADASTNHRTVRAIRSRGPSSSPWPCCAETAAGSITLPITKAQASRIHDMAIWYTNSRVAVPKTVEHSHGFVYLQKRRTFNLSP